MRKIELTLPELAAMSAMVEQELQRACYTRTKAKAALCEVEINFPDNRIDDHFVGVNKMVPTPIDECANVDYWSQRVAMLRKLKAKLEREDAEDDDGL